MPRYDVGTIAEIPDGAHKIISLGKIEVGVYNVEGEFFALTNFCPHQQGPLCEGPTSGEWTCSREDGWLHDYKRPGEIVICPWHGIEFDMRTGRCLSSPKLRVRTFPVEVIDGIISVSTDRA